MHSIQKDFDHEVKPGEIMTGYGKIKGYEYPLLKFVVISESDISAVKRRKRSTTVPMREKRSQVLPTLTSVIMSCMKIMDLASTVESKK